MRLNMQKTKMALIYDFDKTLSTRDMQEFHLLQRLGYENPQEFWQKCGELSHKKNIDSILSYMYMIIHEDKNMTQKSLTEEGKYVEFFPGVDTWFKRINEYGANRGIEIEHFIISSGLTDMVKGSSIASEFKKIYACSYYFDESGRVLWPSRVINYTTKTQYLFRINKGVFDETDDFNLNRSMPEEDKYIPLNRMIYLGDGLTDVPAMKVVNSFGGNTIVVYRDDSNAEELAKDLHDNKRAAFMAKADYSEGGRIENIVHGIIDAVVADLNLDDYR